MAQPMQLLVTYDPSDSVVGNGYLGQVYAVVASSYSWRLITQNLPGVATTGIFPNTVNPYSIKNVNRTFVLPYRGGSNYASPLPSDRPNQGIIAMSVIGIPIHGPDTQTRVPGAKASIWTINSLTAGITGNDVYDGTVSANGVYNYVGSSFITNNAWQNIPGFNGNYVNVDGHSKIIGWAIDGYPIYGPMGYSNPLDAQSAIVHMTSGYAAEIKANRPVDFSVISYGSVTKSTQLRLNDAKNIAPGARLSGPSFPGTVTVLSRNTNTITVDTPITVASNVRLQVTWPLGIFVEDYVYSNNTATLDKFNGRYCVTPEYPDGTYAYFATQDALGAPVYPYFIGNELYGSKEITPPPPPPPLTWVTPGGNLGSLAQGVFFQIQLETSPQNEIVYYQVIAGEVPRGMQVTINGEVNGVPTLENTLSYGNDFTSKFTVRAYTLVNNVVDQFVDNTFSITIAGAKIPDFITPAGSVGSYYDGGPISPIQLEFTGPLLNTFTQVVAGSLPVGLTLNATGEISGYVGLQPNIDQDAGYDDTPSDIYGYDFLATSSSYNYQFTVEITDGRQTNLRTFEIFVFSRNNLTADNTTITADNTEITADQSNDRIPFMLTPQGSIGTVIDDNYFAFQFQAVDLDQQSIYFEITEQFDSLDNWSIPPGLTLDPISGWLYGYIPQQGISTQTFKLAIRVGNVNDLTVISDYYFYTLTIISGIDTRIEWLTPSYLGSIINGATSIFYVEARSLAGIDLTYRLAQGSDSRLPQGLRLLPSGRIAGNCSFNTFALDNGTTTFDTNTRSARRDSPTTFDLTYRFTVNAYGSTIQQLIYQVVSITVVDAGEGFTSTPQILISSPDQDGEPAVAGAVTLVFVVGKGLTIGSVAVANPGYGYRVPPTITVVGGGGSGAQLTAVMGLVETAYLINEDKEFTIKIDRQYNAPLDNLYITALPPEDSRELVENLIQNPVLIPTDKLYRPDDPNFGVAKNVFFVQAYGLPAALAEEYQKAVELNHYWKNITLGPIKTAQALDSNRNVVYEVIYSEIIDDLVNKQGQSVSKQVDLPFPVTLSDGEVVDTVYPNSLINMRTQVIDTLGEISNLLPLWMTSFQSNGQQIGYVPAWVIAYVVPGSSKQIVYNIDQSFGFSLDRFDFEIDRYQLGRNLSYNWDPVYDSTGGAWVPRAKATTFDLSRHYWPVSIGDYILFYPGYDYQAGDIILIPGASLNGLTGVNDLKVFVTNVDEEGQILDFYITGIAPVQLPAGFILYNISGSVINRVKPESIGNSGEIIWATGGNCGTVTEPVTEITNNGLDTQPVTSSYNLGSVADPILTANFTVYVSADLPTTFDGGSLTFVSPADMYNVGDQYDKYIVFPKRNILE
jgi:hypothetical protein